MEWESRIHSYPYVCVSLLSGSTKLFHASVYQIVSLSDDTMKLIVALSLDTGTYTDALCMNISSSSSGLCARTPSVHISTALINHTFAISHAHMWLFFSQHTFHPTVFRLYSIGRDHSAR